jgi:hypothetical protein
MVQQPLVKWGQGLHDFSCTTKTQDGTSYVMQGLAEFERHPSDETACMVRDVDYRYGLIPDPVLCNTHGGSVLNAEGGRC